MHWEGRWGVSPWGSMLLCVRVSMCYMKSVSQREKINEISVTGTSPSTFAHMHTLIPTTDTSPCVTYIHNMCTFLHTAQAHAALCAQSRILMCSLRALLSACVTFNPSTHHFQAHHQTEWKQFSTNAPSHTIVAQAQTIFHIIHIMMRNYADAQCHLGSFLNINNKSVFGIDCMNTCARACRRWWQKQRWRRVGARVSHMSQPAWGGLSWGEWKLMSH